MAEKEYIEREAAIDATYALHFKDLIQEALRNLPAADVRPVRMGKWIDHQEGRWIYAKCSECETVHDVRSNFCPNCGADMREES